MAQPSEGNLCLRGFETTAIYQHAVVPKTIADIKSAQSHNALQR